MDGVREKYINIEQLSSGQIFALLDSIDSDGEDEVDNLMSDSHTEPEPLVSGRSNSNSGRSVLVAEASVHVTNVENIPEGDKQSSEKEKTWMKKTDEPWKNQR